MPNRETTFCSLVNIRFHLDAFLKASGDDLEILGFDPEYVRQEIVGRLEDLFSDELEFVEERYDQRPFAKPQAGDVYGRREAA